MKSAFLIGYVKEAKEKGVSDAEALHIWKRAMEFEPSANLFNALKDDFEKPASAEEVDTLYSQKIQKQAEEKFAEYKKLLGV